MDSIENSRPCCLFNSSTYPIFRQITFQLTTQLPYHCASHQTVEIPHAICDAHGICGFPFLRQNKYEVCPRISRNQSIHSQHHVPDFQHRQQIGIDITRPPLTHGRPPRSSPGWNPEDSYPDEVEEEKTVLFATLAHPFWQRCIN